MTANICTYTHTYTLKPPKVLTRTLKFSHSLSPAHVSTAIIRTNIQKHIHTNSHTHKRTLTHSLTHTSKSTHAQCLTHTHIDDIAHSEKRNIKWVKNADFGNMITRT